MNIDPEENHPFACCCDQCLNHRSPAKDIMIALPITLVLLWAVGLLTFAHFVMA